MSLLRINRESLKQYFFTVSYCLAFLLCYLYFLHPTFEYAGFIRNNSGVAGITLSIFIASLPIFFYKGYKAISGFIAVFIYILLYIPTIITFGIGSPKPTSEIFGIQIVFMFCMILLFLADRFTIKINFSSNFLKNKNVTKLIFNTILAITITLTLYVIWVYKGNLRLVSFSDVYELRTKNVELGTSFFGYLSSWLYLVFVPICLAYGLIYKKKMFFIVACVSCLIIYMAVGSKGLLLFPVLFLGCYWLFKKVSLEKIYSKFIALLSLGLLILLFLPSFSPFVFTIKSLVFWRIVGVGGNLMIFYHDFFSIHPYTYWSHVGVINAITDAYPYEIPLGFLIGGYYWSPLANSNASFWATDGIAAMGMTGVVVVTILLFLILVFFNAITKKINSLYVLLLTLPFLYSLLNTSLFSSLVTGGGLLIMVFFIILNSNSNITTNKFNSVIQK